MLDLIDIAGNLHQSEDGIWFSGGSQRVSYPETVRNRLFSLEDESWWFRHRNALICSLVRAFPPSGEIVDVGGGNGVVSLALERAGFPMILLEPGADGVRNAQARGLGNVVCSTLQAADFHAGVLPAAGLFDVIEHIEDDVRFLQELRTCVVPEGRIYLSVPAHSWLWSAEDDHAGHYRRYDTASLRTVLASAGFGVEYLTPIFALLPLPILLLRRAPSLLGLRLGAPADRMEGQLTVESKLVASVLKRLAHLEARRVARRKQIPFGASLLAVARKAP